MKTKTITIVETDTDSKESGLTVKETTRRFEILNLADDNVQITMDRVSAALLSESLDRFHALATSRTDDILRISNDSFRFCIKNNRNVKEQALAMAFFSEVAHALAASIELFEPLSDALRMHGSNKNY